MTTNSIRAILSATAASEWQAQNELRAHIAAAAKEQLRKNKELAVKNRRASLYEQQGKRNRVARALLGVSAIGALGLSQEFQELIQVHDKPLVLWGGSETLSPGYDMADIHWRTTNVIKLTPTALRCEVHSETSSDYGSTFRNDPFFEHFAITIPYAMRDKFLCTRPLWRLATSRAIDFAEANQAHPTLTYNSDMLFEVLVSCAEPQILRRLVKEMVRRT